MNQDNMQEDLSKRHSWDPIEHPLDGLLADHELVRKLAAKWRGTEDREVRKQAARQLLQAIHTHSRVEESVFYPRLREVDPPMIAHFEQEHLKVDDLVATLQGMTLDEIHADRMFGMMLDSVLHHIEQEEKEFFPKLQDRDMAPVGLEMQSYEANLIHTQAQVSDTGARS